MMNTQKLIPKIEIKKEKPWITQHIILLIEERKQYRKANDFSKEKQISNMIKKQVRLDRQKWLNDILQSGTWDAINKFRKVNKKKQMQAILKNADGEDVAMKEQAEEMAVHLEKKQWHRRSGCGGLKKDKLFRNELDIDMTDISMIEL